AVVFVYCLYRPLRPTRSTLFPYTTLFRSKRNATVYECDLIEQYAEPKGIRTVLRGNITINGKQWIDKKGSKRYDRIGLPRSVRRSEEHTSELQSRGQLVCRLLLEQKKDRR